MVDKAVACGLNCAGFESPSSVTCGKVSCVKLFHIKLNTIGYATLQVILIPAVHM